MRYRLIAIDLDGTLLCPKGEVSEENRAALHAAHEAGAIILPCTGRGWRESLSVIASVPDDELGVFNTGSLVTRLRDGQTIDRAAFEVSAARELIALMSQGDEAVLLFTDPSATGLDYVVTGKGELTVNTRWWFDKNGLRWDTQRQVGEGLLEHVVRVGALARVDRAGQVVGMVQRAMAERVVAFAFEALQDPGSVEPTHIIECFAQGVTKWRGIEWVAKQHGIRPSEIAVIGDQINDVPMFQRAGCAVAMGNAIKAIKDTAHYHTLRNDEHGVAHAIQKMLDGDW